MARYYDTVGWLLSSLGIALLVCGLVLVPHNRLLGDEPVEELASCPGNTCNVTCITNTCFNNYGCTGSNCQCNAAGVPNCDLCECKYGRMACYCGDR